MQRLAVALARARGLDPDRPRNLTRSVILTPAEPRAVILVVCLNPALDITHHVAAVDWAGVNRPGAVHDRPGGKGLNVARTLHALGADVLVTGPGRRDHRARVGAGLRRLGVPAAFTADRRGDQAHLHRGRRPAAHVALVPRARPAVGAAEFAGFLADYDEALAGADGGGAVRQPAAGAAVRRLRRR